MSCNFNNSPPFHAFLKNVPRPFDAIGDAQWNLKLNSLRMSSLSGSVPNAPKLPMMKASRETDWVRPIRKRAFRYSYFTCFLILATLKASSPFSNGLVTSVTNTLFPFLITLFGLVSLCPMFVRFSYRSSHPVLGPHGYLDSPDAFVVSPRHVDHWWSALIEDVW